MEKEIIYKNPSVGEALQLLCNPQAGFNCIEVKAKHNKIVNFSINNPIAILHESVYIIKLVVGSDSTRTNKYSIIDSFLIRGITEVRYY